VQLSDGGRYDHLGQVQQSYNPHEYVMMGRAGTSINDGQELWDKLISLNSNVKLVLSGHDVSGADLPPGTTSRLTSVRPDGSRVHQLLANYQTCIAAPCLLSNQGSTVYGGAGYLRYPPLLTRFAKDLGYNLLPLPRRFPHRSWESVRARRELSCWSKTHGVSAMVRQLLMRRPFVLTRPKPVLTPEIA
jgi:hypothetical protein